MRVFKSIVVLSLLNTMQTYSPANNSLSTVTSISEELVLKTGSPIVRLLIAIQENL